MNHYESSVESMFCATIMKWAVREGITVEILKLNLSGRRGWPDRMIMWEGQHLVFIEFKRPGEKPRPLQSYVHNIIRKLGFTVLVYDDAQEALNDIKTLVQATTATDASTIPTDEGEWSAPIPKAGTWEDSSSS